MKKTLITGAAGFIGFHLSRSLQKENSYLTLIDNFTRNSMDEDFEKLIKQKNVRFINADLAKKDYYSELDEYYDEIYHLAAINGTKYFYEMPYEVLRVNLLTLINLLEWISENNAGKFIFTSSSEVYAGTITEFGNKFDFIPTNEKIPLCIDNVFNERFSYGGSKIAGELLTINYFRRVNMPYSIIRYHNIYGPRMGFEHVVPEFCKRIYDKCDPFELFGGDETRAFCYITDCVDATIKTMRSKKTDNEIVHIGNDTEEVRIIDLAKLILCISNSKVQLKINKAPSGSVKRRCPDISKIKILSGYNPKVGLNQGLMLTLDWYLKKYREMDNYD